MISWLFVSRREYDRLWDQHQAKCHELETLRREMHDLVVDVRRNQKTRGGDENEQER